MPDLVLAIDQGTTSSRAIIFDAAGAIRGVGQQELMQHYPAAGLVEHDADEILAGTRATIAAALAAADATAADIAAIGIANQRETTIVWDRDTGRPVARAIVWQDRRTAGQCSALKSAGAEAEVTARTGLLLDPYFSATKLAWILDNVTGARARAEAGRLAFGTVDSWLLWHLSGGRVHATDTTNAARTMLFNITTLDWDEELLRLFRIPRAVLPEVKPTDSLFAVTTRDSAAGGIAIRAVAGDQQAATIGQACFVPGMMKSTYGTGCFALINTGTARVASRHRLLTTVAYTIDGVTSYALEGSIFVAGAAVQWLRDGLGIIDDAAQSGQLAAAADPAQAVYLVPAFTGLGAPHWSPDARGALYGLTRNTGRAEIAHAALASVCYQTLDLYEAMRDDWQGAAQTVLRVDGGMVVSDVTMQMLADILDAPVDRPVVTETTALGVAWLAGYKAGARPDMAGFARDWSCDRRFQPALDAATRRRRIAGWRDAVRRTL
ncbi:MAG: glycerol kinase GlpK [Hyphomicrobiaceae bacterium]